jgi:hypothetical protein
MSSPVFIRLHFVSHTSHVAINAYVVKIYLLHMHKGSQSNQIMYCTSISHKLFPKYRISVRGSISSSLKGERILSKGEHSFRGE